MPTSIIFLILNYFYLLNNQQIKLYCYKLRKKHTIWLRYLAPLFGSAIWLHLSQRWISQRWIYSCLFFSANGPLTS
jgi:hypothetical protein